MQKAQVQTFSQYGKKAQFGDTKFLDSYKNHVKAQRAELEASVGALGQFQVRTHRVADSIDVMTDKIRAGKMGLREMVSEFKSGGMADVVKQQIALRKSVVQEFGRFKDGSLDATSFTPDRNAISLWRNMGQAVGQFNTILGHGADAMVNWGKNTQWAGRQITAGFTMPILLAGAAAGKMYYELDKGLTQVVKVYGDAATEATTSDREIRDAAMRSARAMADAYGQSSSETIDIAGQLAAVGKTGIELQEATAEVSRARILGEIDLQDAMKATITLQSVWNMSSRELADSFNYMNSMENQTVLTMDDFVEGIPKVAGIIKELNGDVQEAGTLLLAMKAGGIEAAEGATAIKSVAFKVMAPTNAALKTFQHATGKVWSEVMEGSESVLERLQKFGEATKDLGMEERVGLIQKLFGLHQGSKALTIIGQLTDGSEQMARAFEVAQAGSEEWADTAARELEKLTASDWNQFQQALEQLKIQISELGEVFVPMGTKIMKGFSKVIEFFDSLPSFVKKTIGGVLLGFALLGPALMAIGIGANAVGNAFKGITNVVGLFFKDSKLLTAEEAVREKISARTTKRLGEESLAYSNLAANIEKATRALERQVAMQAAKAGRYDLLEQKYLDANLGSSIWVGDKYLKNAPENRKAILDYQASIGDARLKSSINNPWSPQAVAASGQIKASTEKAAEATKKMSANSKIFAAAMLASVAGMAAGGGESKFSKIAEKVGEIGFMTAALLPTLNMIPGLTTKIGAGFKSIGTSISSGLGKIVPQSQGIAGKMANAFKGGITRTKMEFMSLLPHIGAIGMGLGAAALAAGAAFYLINKHIQQSKKEMEALNDSARTYSEILGFQYLEAGEKFVEETGEKVQSVTSMMEKFKELSPDAVAQLKKYVKEAEDMTESQSDAFFDRIARGEMLKVINAGGTEEQAKNAAKIALSVMGQEFNEADLEVRVNALIDFDAEGAQLEAQLDNLQEEVQRAIKGKNSQGVMETIWGVFTGQGGASGQDIFGINNRIQTAGLSKASIAAIEGQADEMWKAYQAASADAQPEVWDKIATAMDKARQDKFHSLKARYASDFAELGVSTIDEFEASITDFQGKLPIRELQEYQGILDTSAVFVRRLATEHMNLETTRLDKVFDPHLLTQYLNGTKNVTEETRRVDEARRGYNMALQAAAQAGYQLSDAEKLALLNTYRLGAGLSEATSLTHGFTGAVDGLNSALNRINPNAFSNIGSVLGGITPPTISGLGFTNDNVQDLVGEYKTIMTDWQSSMFAAAEMEASWAAQEAEAALSRQFEQSRRNLEAAHESANKAMQARHERASEALQARQEASDKRQQKKQEDLRSKWERIMEKAADDNEKRRKRIESSYDTRIKGIQSVIDKEQEAEDIRQKIFEAEKTRLSRMAQLANKNIDFNIAMNTGDLDAAARISNDLQATQEGWHLDDNAEAAKDAWDKRKETLTNQIKSLEEAKKAELDKIKEVEKAEKKALEEKKKREEEALKLENERIKKSFEAQRKALQKAQQAENEAARKRQQEASRAHAEEERKKRQSLQRKEQMAKASLETELATIRAYVPRNKSEMDNQMRQIEKAYDDYGVKLGIKGGQWSKVVGDKLESHIKQANTRMANNADWIELGSVIARNMVSGAFGLTIDEWTKWVSGGAVPKLSPAKTTSTVRVVKDSKTGAKRYVMNTPSGLIKHSGGIIGRNEPNRRTGISGNYLSPSEVPATLRVGEAVLNRRATSNLGHDMIDYFNEGGDIKEGIGGPDLATPFTNIYTTIGASAIIAGLRTGIKNVSDAKRNETPAYAAVGDSAGALYPGGWVRPIAGRVSSRYGMRPHPIKGTYRMHAGTDIPAPMGAPIYAARGGTVTFARYSGGRGNLTMIAHGGGLTTAYAHQSAFGVKVGDKVRTGQYIGRVGSTGLSTGPHLHFEYYVNGQHRNPGLIIPGFEDGGFTMSDGLAELHKGETILTAPLSEKLRVGIDNMADTNPGITQLTLDLRGANINGIDDLEDAVTKIMEKKESKVGRRRVIR